MSVGRDYLELVLRLRRLVSGWVEYCVGPPELIDAVNAGGEVTAERLLESVHELGAVVRDEVGEQDRSRWLLAQLGGISTALRWLEGEVFDYAALFERCHGETVGRVPDRRFEQAHTLLDHALPGHGDVPARYRAWRETQLVPRDLLKASLELLGGEIRGRCRQLFGLPDGEQVTWELVSGVPWAGNAEYLGQLKTQIKINAGLPISSHRLLQLVCHEAYPGHHAEQVCKEASLIRQLDARSCRCTCISLRRP